MNAAQTAKVAEARAVLTLLGFPPAQSNERSALVLLCLLEMAPTNPWARASGEKLWRTHQIMQSPAARALLRTHDKDGFGKRVARYLRSKPGPTARHARTRGMKQIPATLADGTTVTLTAGGQNVLIKEMVDRFCPRWTPGGRMLYVGDAGTDDPVFDERGFEDLGVRLDKHGKLPDLVVHMADRDWLVLMEAASSHGPVDGKRRVELAKLFADCSAGLVYVSCFPSRAVMRRFLADISWETEVWCAEDPTHLIHFNGERFLGPHV